MNEILELTQEQKEEFDELYSNVTTNGGKIFTDDAQDILDEINNKQIMAQGDCLVVSKQIPDNSVDLILTDPPYNIARKSNFESMGRSSIDFGEWDHDADILSWIDDASRALKPTGTIIIFNDWHNLGDISKKLNECGLIEKDIFRWIKANPMPRNRDRRYITDFEMAIVAVGKKKWTFNRQDDKYERPEFRCPIVAGKEKFHPTQKPVQLMEHLLKIHSNENDIVLDPFAGSGSTGVACANLNRRFLGIELDKKYFEIAKERIESVQKENINS